MNQPQQKEKTDKEQPMKITDTFDKNVSEPAFCEKQHSFYSSFDLGAFYTGIEILMNGTKKLNKQTTNYAGNLTKNMSHYFQDSIESYKQSK